MAEQIDLARLVAQLDADFKPMAKNLAKLDSTVAAALSKVEKRTNVFSTTLNKQFQKFTGVDALKGALLGLTAVGLVGGLVELVKTSLEAAAAIEDVAKAANVSTRLVQQFRFALVQSGADAKTADAALEEFAARYGQFINTGAGRAATAFKQLGLENLISEGKVHGTEEAFDTIIAKIQGVGTESKRAGYLASIFGQEMGPKLLQYVDQGAAGIKAFNADADKMNLIMSDGTIKQAKIAQDELARLSYTIGTEATNAVSAFAPQIADLAKTIALNLPKIIGWVSAWAEWLGLIQQSKLEKVTAQIEQIKDAMAHPRSFVGDVETAVLPGFAAAQEKWLAEQKAALPGLAKQQAALLKEQQDQLNKAPPGAKPPADTITDIAGQKAAAAAAQELERLNEQRRQFFDQLGVDAKTVAAALVAAQDQSLVALLRGQTGYYAAVVKQINDEYAAKVEVVDAEEKKQIDSLDKLKLANADYQKFLAQIEDNAAKKKLAAEADRQVALSEPIGSLNEQIKALDDERAGLGLTQDAADRLRVVTEGLAAANALAAAGETKLSDAMRVAVAKYIDASKQNEQARLEMQKQVEMADALRDGLENIGEAALGGAKSFKQAVGEMLKQIAVLILKLYVLGPLIKAAFGDSGTPLGGALGSILGLPSGGGVGKGGGLPGFATGGSPPVGRASIVGERGPELFIPRVPGSIVPNSAWRGIANSGGGGVAISIDARGAQAGVADQIAGALQRFTPTLLNEVDRRRNAQFPTNFNRHVQYRL